MCGILGYFRTSNSTNIDYRLPGCLESMSHRGPDDQGIERFDLDTGTLLLAHKRLSIIDLSKDGHQPMFSSDNRLVITYNGELYNYVELKDFLISKGFVFQTKTDTEVLLNCWKFWGVDCLEKLEGMFSFAIYDFNSQDLYLVRDAFGIKPLYYKIVDNNLFFSSESDSICYLSEGKITENIKQSYNYLINGVHDDSKYTFYKDVLRLLPGSYLKYNLKEFGIPEITQWWNPSIEKDESLSKSKATTKVRELFLDSVDKHLRSDAPLGAALSGGIDSSSIVSAIRFLKPDYSINTFSYIAKESSVNEEHWINIMNHATKSNSHKAEFNSEEILAGIDEFILAQNEPVSGLSYFAEYSVYKLAKENGIKVMLDGHGADEALCGYIGYPNFRILSLLSKKQYHKVLPFIYNWSKWPGRSNDDAIKYLKTALHQYRKYNGNDKFLNILYKLFKVGKKKSEHSNRVPRPKLLDAFLNDEYYQRHNTRIDYIDDFSRSLVSKLVDELMVASCPPQLKGADKSAMIRSIENRVPFLSIKFVEYLLSLPEDYLISNDGRTKSIFRDAMKDIVPQEILNRKDKIGYATPPTLELPLTDELRSSLNDAIEKTGFLERKEVFKIMSGSSIEKISLEGDSWRFFNYLKWVEMHDKSVKTIAEVS